jgi:hypothetical protein
LFESIEKEFRRKELERRFGFGKNFFDKQLVTIKSGLRYAGLSLARPE